jgi:hypothetical protein
MLHPTTFEPGLDPGTSPPARTSTWSNDPPAFRLAGGGSAPLATSPATAGRGGSYSTDARPPVAPPSSAAATAAAAASNLELLERVASAEGLLDCAHSPRLHSIPSFSTHHTAAPRAGEHAADGAHPDSQRSPPQPAAPGDDDLGLRHSLMQVSCALGAERIPPFLTKLFQIVTAAETDDCVRWSPSGTSFQITQVRVARARTGAGGRGRARTGVGGRAGAG